MRFFLDWQGDSFSFSLSHAADFCVLNISAMICHFYIDLPTKLEIHRCNRITKLFSWKKQILNENVRHLYCICWSAMNLITRKYIFKSLQEQPQVKQKYTKEN